MAKGKGTVPYTLREGNKVTYIGITNDPDRRASEHRSDGKEGDMRIEGPPMSRESAQKWERERMETYQKNHGGNKPPENG